jgi:NADH-quinone oxidoreductase subunit J
MTGMQFIFLIDAAVTIFAGVMMVTARKLIHAALWLILCLFGVAVVFGLLEASFIAIVQVVVYIGAIAILIVFAIMLTHEAVDDSYKNNRRWIMTAVIALIALGGILLALFTWPQGLTLTTPLSSGQQDIGEIGLALLNPEGYLIPFEVSSILLLAALVGAVYVGIERREDKK